MTTAIQVTDIDSLARVAKMAHGSGLARVQSVEAAGVVIMAGLELGLTPMQALLGIHLVEGKPVIAADTLVAIVRRSRVCKSWRTVESTARVCTIETLRAGDESPVMRTWTIDDAKAAGLTGKPIWQKYPRAMLRHRCATDLAREVYPDVVLGMYDPEELDADDLVTEPAPEIVVAAAVSDERPRTPTLPAHSSPTQPVAATDVATATAAALRGIEAPAAPVRTPADDLRDDVLEQIRRAESALAAVGVWIAAREECVAALNRAALTVVKSALRVRVSQLRECSAEEAGAWIASQLGGDSPTPPDGTSGPAKPRSSRRTTATGEHPTGAAAATDGPVACVREPVWSQSPEALRAHLAGKTCVAMLRNSAKAHAAELTDDAVALYAARYREFAYDAATDTRPVPSSATATVRGWIAEAVRADLRRAA